MIKTTLIAVAAAATMGWASFNMGFELGSDTGACIALVYERGVGPSDVEFCEHATPMQAPLAQAVRKSWLGMRGEA